MTISDDPCDEMVIEIGLMMREGAQTEQPPEPEPSTVDAPEPSPDPLPRKKWMDLNRLFTFTSLAFASLILQSISNQIDDGLEQCETADRFATRLHLDIIESNIAKNAFDTKLIVSILTKEKIDWNAKRKKYLSDNTEEISKIYKLIRNVKSSCDNVSRRRRTLNLLAAAQNILLFIAGIFLGRGRSHNQSG